MELFKKSWESSLKDSIHKDRTHIFSLYGNYKTVRDTDEEINKNIVGVIPKSIYRWE